MIYSKLLLCKLVVVQELSDHEIANSSTVADHLIGILSDNVITNYLILCKCLTLGKNNQENLLSYLVVVCELLHVLDGHISSSYTQ
jgi:hypothetical protein